MLLFSAAVVVGQTIRTWMHRYYEYEYEFSAVVAAVVVAVVLAVKEE